MGESEGVGKCAGVLVKLIDHGDDIWVEGRGVHVSCSSGWGGGCRKGKRSCINDGEVQRVKGFGSVDVPEIGLKDDEECKAVLFDSVLVLANEVLETLVEVVSVAEFLVGVFGIGIKESGVLDQGGNDGLVGGASGRGGYFGNNGGADVFDNSTSVVPVGAILEEEVDKWDDNGVRINEQEGEAGVVVVVTEDDL